MSRSREEYDNLIKLFDTIKELKAGKAELLKALIELLQDAIYLYQYDPNAHRKTPEEYFKQEIDIINKYKDEI